MAKKKVYLVSLISRSVQTKLVYASSPDEAKEMAEETDWEGTEEMLDSEIEVRKAVLKGNEKKGEYPDFYESDYVFTDDDCIRYNELKNQNNG